MGLIHRQTCRCRHFATAETTFPQYTWQVRATCCTQRRAHGAWTTTANGRMIEEPSAPERKCVFLMESGYSLPKYADFPIQTLKRKLLLFYPYVSGVDCGAAGYQYAMQFLSSRWCLGERNKGTPSISPGHYLKPVPALANGTIAIICRSPLSARTPAPPDDARVHFVARPCKIAATIVSDLFKTIRLPPHAIMQTEVLDYLAL